MNILCTRTTPSRKPYKSWCQNSGCDVECFIITSSRRIFMTSKHVCKFLHSLILNFLYFKTPTNIYFYKTKNLFSKKHFKLTLAKLNNKVLQKTFPSAFKEDVRCADQFQEPQDCIKLFLREHKHLPEKQRVWKSPPWGLKQLCTALGPELVFLEFFAFQMSSLRFKAS